ncbi:MAG: sporulation protein [Ruminococcus sp.]|nr:sporulation protein [Ruminococcus sp.]
MNIKMIAAAVLAAVLLLVLPAVRAHGDELSDIREQVQSELEQAAGDEVSESLEEEGISVSDPESIKNADPKSIFGKLFLLFRESLRQPLRLLARLIGISVLCAVMRSASGGDGLSAAYERLCIIAVIVMMGDMLSSMFESLKSSVDTVNGFMISFIPVFSALTSASGAVNTAQTYTASSIVVCEVSAFISSCVVMPLLCSVTAIGVVSAVQPGLRLSGVAGSVKKAVSFILAAVMMIFTGLMKLQGIMAASADSMASKTLRMAATSFIPVIGGSVSDAYLAVKSGMGMIRSAAGVFGIGAVAVIAARPLLSLLALKLTVFLAKVVNELLGQSETAAFLDSMNSVLSIALAMLISLCSAFIISAAIILDKAL